MSHSHWLLKSEGSCYSIDDLKSDERTAWTGIRNFQARNYMRDAMKAGDLCLFYHSSGTPAEPSGVYGIARVASAPHPDATALDPKDEHYDPKHEWVCVDVAFVKKLTRPLPLAEIKKDKELRNMLVCQPGQRLSIMPVEEKHFERVVELASKDWSDCRDTKKGACIARSRLTPSRTAPAHTGAV